MTFLWFPGAGRAPHPLSRGNRRTRFSRFFRDRRQGGRNHVKKQLPGWAVLLIITLIAGLALGGTYALTKDPIAEQAALAAENARKAALPDADAFEELTLPEDASVDWAYAGLKDGTVVGYVVQKTVNGFGGKVEVITGVDTTQSPDTFSIGGISVGGSNFSETAGLGARSKEPAFTDQFIGKIYPVSFIKAGGEKTDSTVDALTSATITTTAVVNGVNDIVKYVKGDILGIAGVEMPALPAGAQVYSASAQGFRGPVYVEAAFSGNTVSYISVGDENFAEDIGAGVREPDFMIQFIGKEMPLEISDIDAISGATISSKAVVTALNNAFSQASGVEIVEPEKPTMPEKPETGVFSATDQGFASPVYVEAAFDDAGKITYISVGDDSFAETQGFGARALEAEEQINFIGAQMPLALDDVDALTGATFTKTAIVNALNKAYAVSKGEVIEEPEPVEQIDVSIPEGSAAFTSPASGLTGSFDVTIGMDENGAVNGIEIGDSDSDMDASFLGKVKDNGEFLSQFIGMTGTVSEDAVDLVSGATVSSKAVVAAVNDALAQAGGNVIEEPEPVAAVDVSIPDGSKTATAKASGLTGTFDVTIGVDENGAVNGIVLGDSDSDMDASFLGKVKDNSAFLAQFIGATGAVSEDAVDLVSGATVSSKAVVAAVNDALAQAAGGETPVTEPDAQTTATKTEEIPVDQPVITEPIVEPDVETSATKKDEQPVDKAVDANVDLFVGEALSFNTAFKVEALFKDDVLSIMNVYEKAVGGTDYAPSRNEAAYQAYFLDKTFPLKVESVSIPGIPAYQSQAVAVAANQAFLEALKIETALGDEYDALLAQIEQPDGIEEDGISSVGEALSFSTSFKVEANFQGDTLASLRVYEKNVGGADYAPSAKEAAYQDYFLQKTFPLDTNGVSIPGVAAYQAQVVAIAINNAYQNSLAGQQ